MKQSLFFKNFLAIALIMFIGFTLLGSLSSTWSYSRSVSERRRMMATTLEETARYVTVQHIYYGLDITDLSLSMWLAFISGVSGFDLLVTDTFGVVTACSERNVTHHGMQLPETLLQKAAMEGYYVSLMAMGDVYPGRRHAAGIQLTSAIGGEAVLFGYMFISSEMEALYRDWQSFAIVFVLIAIFVMALTIAVTFVATKKMAQPINEIARVAYRFARGDLSVRAEDSGRRDEIGHLTKAFNTMADNLGASETIRRDFIANISHELKTPLTVISGFAEGLSDGTIPPEKEKRYLGIIASEARRLSRLVKGMLEMSYIESAKPDYIEKSSFDITEVVRLTLLSLSKKVEGKKIDVEANLPEEAVITQGDGDSITQVVYNLIDNAIKFSKPGGTIKLELWKQGTLVYVSVENQGETISEEELPLIFDKFHKVDKARNVDKEGVGLGLYIVKAILNNHNQDIYVESHDGTTKFVFTLSLLK